MGAELRNTFVSAPEPEDTSAQDRMLTPFVGELPFPITCNGRPRSCAAPGCTDCKRRSVMIVRSITQPARRQLDLDNPGLVLMLLRVTVQISRARRAVLVSR